MASKEELGIRGLSPRVRGNPLLSINSTIGGGSIPARAGEPSSPRPKPPAPSVYPRACGGTRLYAKGASPWQGLSPRVRGNRKTTDILSVTQGSIPARAGEPSGRTPRTGGRGVYPRACGGTSKGRRGPRAYYGLSPRVRGNPLPPFSMLVLVRSIPARAGEPATSLGQLHLVSVYPRACGGTGNFTWATSFGIGLSPRVRGNPYHYTSSARRLGSIPARAGEPHVASRYSNGYEVYPRACGGTTVTTSRSSS